MSLHMLADTVIATTVSAKLEVARFSSEGEIVHYVKLPDNTNGVAIDVAATQTYGAALAFPVNLKISWGVGNVITQIGAPNQYQFDVQRDANIVWQDPFTTHDKKRTHDEVSLQTSANGKYAIVRLVYQLPTPSVALDSTTYDITFSARVSQSSGSGWGDAGTDNHPGYGFQWGDLVPIAIGGVLIIGGLWALGFASEKTGINAGTFKGIKLPKIKI